MSINKKNKSIMFKIMAIIVVIVWMIIVFQFSGQNGYKSLNLSGKVIKKVEQFIKPTEDVQVYKSTEENNLSKVNENKKYIYAYSNKVQLYVRKTAHFILYMIGGFTLSVFFYFFTEFDFLEKKKSKKGFIKGYMILAMIIGVCYAISDEIHQKYVFGRTSSIKDVFIDSAGVVTGILLTAIVINLIVRIKNKRRKKED